MTTPSERLWAKVNKTSSSCWLWTGAKNSKGYGQIGVSPHKLMYVHRFSWQLHNGPIPTGLCVLHRCDTPLCVNPDHLFLGTQLDNIKDMRNKGRGFVPVLKSGEKHPRSKFTWEEIKAIRRLNTEGASSYKIAEQFHVHPTSVQRIVKNKTWKESSMPS